MPMELYDLFKCLVIEGNEAEALSLLSDGRFDPNYQFTPMEETRDTPKKIAQRVIKTGDLELLRKSKTEESLLLGKFCNYEGLFPEVDNEYSTIPFGLVSAIMHERLQRDMKKIDKASEYIWPVTPLYLAISKGCFDLVRCLVENGAKINAASGPLHCSALFNAVAFGQEAIAKYLLSKGANIQEQIDIKLTTDHLGFQYHSVFNYKGVTLLHLATQLNFPLAFITDLLRRGADASAVAHYSCSSEVNATYIPSGGGGATTVTVQMLKQIRFNYALLLQPLAFEFPSYNYLNHIPSYGLAAVSLSANNAEGWPVTPLYFAISSGNMDLLQCLVEGAHVNLEQKCGPFISSALVNAIAFEKPEAASYLLAQGSNPKVTVDIDMCVDIIKIQNRGVSALHLAVQLNFSEAFVRALMNKGADPTIIAQYSPITQSEHVKAVLCNPAFLPCFIIPLWTMSLRLHIFAYQYRVCQYRQLIGKSLAAFNSFLRVY